MGVPAGVLEGVGPRLSNVGLRSEPVRDSEDE